MKIKPWMRAMRLHTLPVSAAGVIAGSGCALYEDSFKFWPFLICLFFALLAQITSNFANEYFDFKNGLDKKGRQGFRRGVTEGDISPTAMKMATFAMLVVTCLLGCLLIIWGGAWIILIGIAVALFALGYSAGPYPLSHHCLGELAVLIFFGIVPVTMTCYLQTGDWSGLGISLFMGTAIGLMGANVLIVNNYRDMEDDMAVGKFTLAVKFGRKAMGKLYLANGFIAAFLAVIPTALIMPALWELGPLIYLNLHYLTYKRLIESDGQELNPILGRTAMLLFLFSIWILLALAFNSRPIVTIVN